MPQTSVLTNALPAFAGMLGDSGRDMNLATALNSEAALQLPFGTMVMQGTTDQGALCLTAGNVAKIIGAVVYSGAYQKGVELGVVADANSRIGIMPTVPFNVLKRGRIWVQVEEAVTPASAVRVRCTAAGTGSGTFRTTSAGAGLSMLLANARYLDTAGISGFSRVEFDVLLRGSYTAD